MGGKDDYYNYMKCGSGWHRGYDEDEDGTSTGTMFGLDIHEKMKPGRRTPASELRRRVLDIFVVMERQSISGGISLGAKMLLDAGVMQCVGHLDWIETTRAI